MSDVQGYRESWTRWNHDFAGGKDDEGYAICRGCSCTENSMQAAEFCVEGPVVLRLRQLANASIEREWHEVHGK